jgi:IclR family acetate operon transcriptional repressor
VAVKQVQSASRALAAFEALAEHQPMGVGALARVLDDDKSAVQRALVTLAEAGWIQRTTADPGQWELTSRIVTLAQGAHGRASLRARARPVLEALRDETGETLLLSVPEDGKVVVLDVVESNQLVRTAPNVGLAVPAETSAAGTAILAWLPADELDRYVDGPVTRRLRTRLAEVRARGWSVNDRESTPGASAVGAPVLSATGHALGSITISGPASRLPSTELDRLGAVVRDAAARLSG